MKSQGALVCLLGLGLGSVHGGDVSHLLEQQRRHLGSVQTEVGTSNYLEFNSNQTVGSLAYGCSVNCSASGNSVALRNNSAPWTFNTSSPNCTTLWVIQGYGTGDSIWTVSDGSTVLGDTSLGVEGSTCQSDPNVCFQNLTSTGYGSWNLTAGAHSISIRVVRQNKTVDAGWFRVDRRSCTSPTGPTKPPTKAPTQSPGKSPTKAPAPPTKKPTKSPSTTSKPASGAKCLGAQKCAQQLIQKQRLCRCNPIFAGKRKCIKNKSVKVCCPNDAKRPSNYQQRVFQIARDVYCNPF